MKRDLWTSRLTKKTAPEWPCPECKTGTLALDPKSFAYEEPPRSVEAHEHDSWDPDWIQYIFSTWLSCANAKCGLRVALIGKGGVEAVVHDQGMNWEAFYSPLHAYPMPDIFDLPAKCPDDVAAPLRRSFAALWSEPSSAANSARVALEALMDAMGVARKKRTAKGTYAQLSLHKRIQELQQVNRTIADQLMAVKWLGNSGSHESNVTVGDILDAYEIIEHALDELINERSKRVAVLAKKLTRKHAPKK